MTARICISCLRYRAIFLNSSEIDTQIKEENFENHTLSTSQVFSWFPVQKVMHIRKSENRTLIGPLKPQLKLTGSYSKHNCFEVEPQQSWSIRFNVYLQFFFEKRKDRGRSESSLNFFLQIVRDVHMHVFKYTSLNKESVATSDNRDKMYVSVGEL